MRPVRSALAYAASFIVLVVVLGVCMGSWSLTRPRPGSPSPSGASAASGSPRASGPATSAAPGTLEVFGAGALPADFRFVFVGDAGDERLLLLDLAKHQITEVAHFLGTGDRVAGRNVELTASVTGDVIVLLLRGDGKDSLLHVVRPVRGELRTFTIAPSESPRLAPDGRTLAVGRTSTDANANGIWTVDITDGSEKRLVPEPPGPKASRPLAWSADGSALAVLVDPDAPGQRVGVVAASGGPVKTIAPGTGARWRAGEVLFWDARSPGPVKTYDTASASVKDAFPSETGRSIDRAEPKPRATDIATLEHGESGGAQLVVHGTERAAAVLVPDASGAIAIWWSLDGAHLYLWSNDNGTTTVTDVLTKTLAVRFCLRRTVAPPCS